MKLRLHCDPESGQPHIYNHGVSEEEVLEVMRRPGDDFKGRRNSRIALGQTYFGRHLQVIYVPDKEGDSIFVITAFELRGKALKAYRRRLRRKGK